MEPSAGRPMDYQVGDTGLCPKGHNLGWGMAGTEILVGPSSLGLEPAHPKNWNFTAINSGLSNGLGLSSR